MSGRVVLASGDLLFGSKVEGMIREAGFEPVAAGAEDALLVIVDLTNSETDPAEALALARASAATPAMAYFAHTDDEIRRKALAAGYEKVVPRSRMMREGVDLIKALAAP
jgi:DNA-binding NarL/FixJ family response regulator